MLPRISVLWFTAFILLAVTAFAVQEDPILGQTGGYAVKKSDVERLLVFYPPEAQQRLRENAAEMEVLVKRMPEVKIMADVARKKKFDQQAQVKKQLDHVVDDFLSKEYLLKKDFIKEQLKEQVVAFKVKEFIRKATESAGMRVFADRISGK